MFAAKRPILHTNLLQASQYLKQTSVPQHRRRALAVCFQLLPEIPHGEDVLKQLPAQRLLRALGPGYACRSQPKTALAHGRHHDCKPFQSIAGEKAAHLRIPRNIVYILIDIQHPVHHLPKSQSKCQVMPHMLQHQKTIACLRQARKGKAIQLPVPALVEVIQHKGVDGIGKSAIRTDPDMQFQRNRPFGKALFHCIAIPGFPKAIGLQQRH